jgi:D-threo-aldose 1-dehydrogenase
MKLVPLATTGRDTTQLGFGCAFSPSVTKDDAMKLLDAAFDAGIRHFDVAPYYSDGAAEAYLGNFLSRHSGQATVTTKYGLLPSSQRPLHIRVARTLLGPAVRTLRHLRNRGVAQSTSAGVTAKAAFTAEEARLSLERSLKLLQLDKIDVFLMHEPTVADLADDRLLQILHDSIAFKRIGAFGIGCDSSRVVNLYKARRAYCDVLQFDWTAFSPDYDLDGSFRIHFWVFSRKLQTLHKALLDQPGLCRLWSSQSDVDLANIRELAAIMLKAALVRNPNSIVLFTSSNPDNILRNVRIAEDATFEAKALRFCQLVKQQGGLLR